jgi:hypothetical protein
MPPLDPKEEAIVAVWRFTFKPPALLGVIGFGF